MAKVKIQGNASGTGVLTVTAPNTSTDRTITLPDGTGTLIADDGNNNLVLSGAVSSVGANANASVVNRTGSDGDVISIKKDGSEKGNIGINGSNIHLNSEGGTIKLQVSGTDTYNGDSTAWYPATDNAKDLGYASFRYKDLYLSGGLKVGGTGADNTLDDYEEGTWTPVLTDLSNNATMHSLSTGSYTKIGRVVTVTGNVRTSSLNSVSGNLYISGLPYGCAPGNGFHAAGAIANAENFSITAGNSIAIYMSANATNLRIDIYDSTVGVTVMQASEWTSDGQIAISVTYFAA